MSTIAEKLTTVAENIPKVYEAGKKSEYDAFWDVLQSNGNAQNYNYLFANGGWNDEIYNPKHPLALSTAVGIFISQTKITDTKVPIYAQGVYLNQTFSAAKSIKTIRDLYVNESTTYNLTFSNCDELEELNMVGTIGRNNFDVSTCKSLNTSSLLSILKALSKDSAVASGKNITFASVHESVIYSDANCLAYYNEAISAGWRINFA